MFYSCPIDEILSGWTGTDRTVASLTVADTAGNRCRVRSITLGGEHDAQDAAIKVKLQRIADLSAGTAGTATAVTKVPKTDPGAPDSIITCKTAYTAEPTAYEAESVWIMGFNHRGTMCKEWDEENAPVITRDQLFGLLVTTESLSGKNVNGTIKFEVF